MAGPREKTWIWPLSIRLRDCDDRWTRPMSITWLSSDLGASKCYRDGDKPRPPSDMPVISSDPGPSSTSRMFICSCDQHSPENALFIIYSSCELRGCCSLKKKEEKKNHRDRKSWNLEWDLEKGKKFPVCLRFLILIFLNLWSLALLRSWKLSLAFYYINRNFLI